MAEEEKVVETEPKNEEAKTFTQAEVDSIIDKRFAKLMKNMPSNDELTAFRAWQKEHKDDEASIQSITSERDTAVKELEAQKRENYLLKKGVPAEDIDYYAFKIGKLVTDETPFEKAAETFLKDNKPKTVHVDTGAALSGKAATKSTNEEMNALLRGARG